MSYKFLLVRLRNLFENRTINKIKVGGVSVQKNIPYSTEKGHVLDIYRPNVLGKHVDQRIPVIVNFHGGAFVANKKESRKGFCRYMAEKGFAVVNVDYVRAPKYAFPQFSAHALKVFEWIATRGEKHGLDISKIAVCGDGAGAYIAAQVVTMLYNGAYAQEIGAKSVALKPKAAVLFSGMYDGAYALTQKLPLYMQKQIGKEVFGVDVADERAVAGYKYRTAISPLNYITEDFPPVFVAHSVYDSFCPKQGGLLVKKLNAEGIPFWEFKAVHEECIHSWHLYREDKHAIACLRSAVDFLGEAFGEGVKRNVYIEI